jgi:hypothetical protein
MGMGLAPNEKFFEGTTGMEDKQELNRIPTNHLTKIRVQIRLERQT